MAHPEVQMSWIDSHASAPALSLCSSSLRYSTPQRTCLSYTRQRSNSNRRAVYTSVLVHQLKSNCSKIGPKTKDKRGERRLVVPTFSISASAASALEKPILDAESNLIDALIGIEGRGRGTGLAKLETISAAVRSLESLGGVDEPTSSSLIEGTWHLVFTTRPGTASPIQRAFVGVDTFSVFQEIKLRGSDDPRVCNIVQFSKAIGKLKVEAAASIASGRRILFQFDKAAFSFNFLPFKVPYPVPFRLLGDEAKGWLETTYLSPSGNIRISRGNKGTTFILQKEVDLRQQLLQAIASGQGVEKIVEAETGRLQNLAEFFPGLKLRARARSEAISAQRLNINIEGASLEVGSIELPLKITGSGFTEVLYLDTKIRITRGNKGSTFVHVRDE